MLELLEVLVVSQHEEGFATSWRAWHEFEIEVFPRLVAQRFIDFRVVVDQAKQIWIDNVLSVRCEIMWHHGDFKNLPSGLLRQHLREMRYFVSLIKTLPNNFDIIKRHVFN